MIWTLQSALRQIFKTKPINSMRLIYRLFKVCLLNSVYCLDCRLKIQRKKLYLDSGRCYWESRERHVRWTGHQVARYSIPFLALPGQSEQSVGHQIHLVREMQIPGNRVQQIDRDAFAALHDVGFAFKVANFRVEIRENCDQIFRIRCVYLVREKRDR